MKNLRKIYKKYMTADYLQGFSAHHHRHAGRRTVESICQCQPMARHAGGCFYAGGHFLCGIGVV